MAQSLAEILVVDLECTCWEGAPPPGESSEIIEIGLTLLQVDSLICSGKRSILIKPQRSRVSPFCSSLTSLTQEQVEHGNSLSAGCLLLRDEYSSRKRLWASYGNYDREMFEECCRDYSVPYPFGTGYLNVKTLAAMFLGREHELSLMDCLKEFDMTFKGRPHTAADDAWNTAQILGRILALGRSSL